VYRDSHKFSSADHRATPGKSFYAMKQLILGIYIR
jgi:hypothetical protein